MSDKLIYYDSANGPYAPAVRVRTKGVRNGSEAAPSFFGESPVVWPSRIVIYDLEELFQIDFEFDMSIDRYAEEYKRFEQYMNLGSYRNQYPGYDFWNLVDIIPNGNYCNNFYTVRAAFGISWSRTWGVNQTQKSWVIESQKTQLTVCIEGKEMEADTMSGLAQIAEYSTLTDSERAMVHRVSMELSQRQPEKKSRGLDGLMKMFGSKKAGESDGILSSEALIESLHMSESEKQIFKAEMLTLASGSSDSEKELEAMIGLGEVKDQIKKFQKKLQYRQRQKARGIDVSAASSMHMCFTGAPGTGKTTVARILTGILYDLGYIKENKYVEINGQNLKGGYVGQTAILTKLVLKSAKNKILFIDEAYALYDESANGYGKEAVATLLKHMEDERDNTIVIFAGYKKDMEMFLAMNDGLKSRINRYIDFNNYTLEELTQIFQKMLEKKKLYITPEALAKCVLAFKKAALSPRFSNARFARNLIEKIEFEHAYNVRGTNDNRRMDTIEVVDVTDRILEELLNYSM